MGWEFVTFLMTPIALFRKDTNMFHKCREGELLGMDWKDGYPRVTSHCSICRKVIRRIPMDDVPQEWGPVVKNMVDFIRKRGMESP